MQDFCHIMEHIMAEESEGVASRVKTAIHKYQTGKDLQNWNRFIKLSNMPLLKRFHNQIEEANQLILSHSPACFVCGSLSIVSMQPDDRHKSNSRLSRPS